MFRRERNIRRCLFTFMYKKRTARAQLLLCQPRPIAFVVVVVFFFDVLVAAAVLVAKALFYLKRCKCSKNTLCDWLNRVYFQTLTSNHKSWVRSYSHTVSNVGRIFAHFTFFRLRLFISSKVSIKPPNLLLS